MTPYLVPLLAAIAPFFLWPLEMILPYPFIIEELFKACFVLMVLSATPRLRLQLIAGSAIIFSLSETFFYYLNIFFAGNFSTLLYRFLLTTPMHLLTFLIILYFAQKKKALIIAGVLIAILLHYFFNLNVAQISFR